ncbi:thioredoxin domain-containing protein [Roseivirga sp. E12]|uniref:thioredoxin domain-containing protein n=1 Tax=Roseivirga sp. E12 TaxID=2819237 RepID=UPI001ABD1447|nr:thioredoxin domain-containing protein [Roseivirga sp. E12]MBO3697861.1 thioredoxin domain-containing protein [Roseivirga sp. E12]
MADKPFTNRLAEASSPYLLQHAHNPVDWYPWGEEALEKAKKEDKPIIVSIGYSACHWCHVMEHESFEDEDIAAIMNEHFVCIKVDREERPDVDQVYMDAVHAMGLQGGWPLNAFLLPDQRPFYGGTYFPPKGWAQLCNQIGKVFKEQRAELEKSATGFMQTLGRSEVEKYGLTSTDQQFTKEKLSEMAKKFAENFDLDKGGNNRSPKFPMPVTYRFLLREGVINQNQESLDHVERTLNHMTWGGLYDQVGGGFTRYSTDMDWFVPHFEKMLYDNGQLVTLYCEGYQVFKHPLYKHTVYQTIDWLEREMTSPEGGFYSALDADSEGEEGKFYLWTDSEFESLLGSDADLMIDFYNITSGNWEPQKNIPFRSDTNEAFAKKHSIDLDELEDIVRSTNHKLLQARGQRIRPDLDDKILTGWNGLMLKGLCDAFAVFGEDKFLKLALKNAHFLLENMYTEGRLKRSFKNGQASIDGYLEDYAAVTQGFMALYEVTFDEDWLRHADQLTQTTLEEFYHAEEELFFFTANTAEALIARKKEIFDNVIPSSNALMATNLYHLGMLLDIEDYVEKAHAMLRRIDRIVTMAPQDLAHWATFYSQKTYPTAEIAIVSKDLSQDLYQLFQRFIPNRVIVGKNPHVKSSLPLLEGRELVGDKTTFYLCYNKACQLPVNNADQLFEQLQKN